MKTRLSRLFLFTSYFFLFSFSFLLNSTYSQVTKVACIGNSITYGSGIKDREHNSYPAALSRLLGSDYEVKNFGVSGRTLLKHGDFPYTNEKAYTDAKEFLPNIIIIKLGTNDTKPQNWKFKAEFEKDYCDFIDSLSSISSHPKIYICKPVPAYEVRWGINDSVLVNEQIPLIEKIGKEKSVPVIDLHTPFLDKGKYFPDGIHPDTEGAALMADEIYNAIWGKKK